MATKRPKPIRKFNAKMRTKLMVLFSFIVVLLIFMLGWTVFIQQTKGEEYNKKLISLQSSDNETIPFQRGDITDTNGTVLATSVAKYNLILDCSIFVTDDGTESKYLQPTLEALNKYFDLDEDYISDYIEQHESSKYAVMKKELSYSQVETYNEMLAEKDEKGNKLNPNVKGVWFEKTYERSYPMGSLAASVIGFTSDGTNGRKGLECYYNSVLNGVDGREYGYLNSDSTMEKTVIDAQNGDTIVTSLDSNIQAIVEEKIQEFYDEYTCNYRLGGGFEHCSVIVMNPNNGEILAMASSPTFDPNDPGDLDDYYTEAEQESMTDQEKSNFLYSLWANYAVTTAYEPGSVQKPITVSAALDNGDITVDDTFECDGKEEIQGEIIKCVNTKGHGEQSVADALKNSCNDSLMQISYKIGIDTFAQYQSIMNFGQLTGIDLPEENSCSQYVRDADSMSTIDMATNAFGQNFDCTMVQMVSAFSSLINGGYYYQPHLVTKTLDADGNTVSTVEPTMVKQTISSETSQQIKDLLEQVVASGTANTAKVDGYSMGGKTGTAEMSGRNKIDYVVSFMGYAPADDPQLVIYCVIDRPNVEDQAHSTYAQNITREILEEVFPYMNIYPDEEETGLNEKLDITGNNEPEYTVKIPGDSIWAQKAAEKKAAAKAEAEEAAKKAAEEAEKAASEDGDQTTGDAETTGTDGDTGTRDNDKTTGTTGNGGNNENNDYDKQQV